MKYFKLVSRFCTPALEHIYSDFMLKVINMFIKI